MQPGKYLVRVKNCGFQPPKDGRPPQLTLYFEDDRGEGISWWSSMGYLKDGGFSMPAFEFGCNQLAGLGWDAAARNFAFEELADPATSPIFDREAEIVVVDEPFNGESKIKVKYINDPDRPRGGGERMEASDSKAWAESIRQKLREQGKSVPTSTTAFRPTPTPPVKPQDFSAEDIQKAKDAGVGSEPINLADVPF